MTFVERDTMENVGFWIGNRLLPRNLNVPIVRRDMMVNADILQGHVLDVVNWDIRLGNARIGLTEERWRLHRLFRLHGLRAGMDLHIAGDEVAGEGLVPGQMLVKQPAM